ncbi:MAG: MoaD/ThiS family protein [Chloroflexi bacterium]|nr:MoaD/ThiS family protein [Chloroflexota bacterium]
MHKIKILLFATMRTRAKRSSLELEIKKDSTVAELKEILVAEIPALEASLHHTLVSIDREFAFDEDIIPENAEIALFPPVSGG